MNEWLDKRLTAVKTAWGKWSALQKGIAAGIALVAALAIVLLITLSSRPAPVRLFNGPVNDDRERENILSRLDEDNVTAYVSSDNYISVDDEETARKYRSILIAEGYAPSRLNAYSLFDVSDWSRSDFTDNVNWKRSVELQVKQHLEALDGIDRAEVVLTLPENSLFADNQAPTTASVVLYAHGGSDILEDRRQIRGIQNLILKSVEGLREENITIVDGATSLQVNDFATLAETDRISNIEREQRLIQRLQAEIASRTLAALVGTFSSDRVRIANVSIDMDMSERTATSREYSGITVRPDDPDTPYDDSDVRDSLVISEETLSKSSPATPGGAGGDAGGDAEGAPSYSGAGEAAGTVEDDVRRNYALNERNTSEVLSPRIERITVAVNIDGAWKEVHDENGERIIENGEIKRTYTPVSPEDLNQATRLVRDAVGYNAARGDSVTVTNIPFDRTAEHEAEDRAELERRARNRFAVAAAPGAAVAFGALVVLIIIACAVRRHRRKAAEKRAARQAAGQGAAGARRGEPRAAPAGNARRAGTREGESAAEAASEDAARIIRAWMASDGAEE